MDKPVLVVRYIEMFNVWYLCHAKSYQNAYVSGVNGFKTREAAVAFAKRHGHSIEHHSSDWLQRTPQEA